MQDTRTGEELYEGYIGAITPEEFVAPFNGDFEAAIASVLADWVWDDEIPENFEHKIHRYLYEQGVAKF